MCNGSVPYGLSQQAAQQAPDYSAQFDLYWHAGFATFVERQFALAIEMGLKASFETTVVHVDEMVNGTGFMITTDEGQVSL